MLQRSNPVTALQPRTGRGLRSITLRVVVIAFLALMGVLGVFLQTHLSHQGAHAASPVPLGLNVDVNEQTYVDLLRNEARFQQIDGTTAPLTEDTNGWPTSDFEWIIDNRYTFAWISGATNIDPLKRSTDISGTYHLSFKGLAVLTSADGGDPSHAGTTVTNQQYDSASNTTTADVNITNPAGGVLVDLQFTQTRRNPGDTPGTGITNMKAIRPGYPANSTQVFTDLWLSALKNHNWTAFRFMSVLGTNDYADPATDQHPNNELYPIRLNWPTDRLMPDVGPLYGQVHPGVHGNMPWEYVVLVAQATDKDIWINLPVNASDDYVNQVANLLKNGNSYTGNQGIPSNINVYVEYSNEMWHYGFHQGPWNNQAAKDEVAAGGSNLNYDNCNDNNDCWRFRRIAKRTLEIGNQFKSVFNDNGTRIRPVINNAFTQYDTDMLTYVQNNYGTVSNNIYGISQTGYYTSADASSVDAIINGEMAASDTNKGGYQTSRNIANQFGIHSLVYEGGQDEEGNKSATNSDPTLANKFAAARDPRMQQVEVHDANNWFGVGGELYMQFSEVSRYSTYGMWGLSEDLTNQSTGKWQGVDQIMGGAVTSTPTPTPTNTPTSVPTSTPTATPVPTNTPSPTPSPTATPITGGGLPSPWQDSNVGSVGQAGSGSYANGVFTVSGSGSDIWGSNDAFNYVYQPLNGDGTIIAEVNSVQNTDCWAKAGVMIRETLNDNSTFADTLVTPSCGSAFQRRTSTGASAVHTAGPGVTAPYWVELVRSGNTFTGSISSDGVTWTQVGSDTISMASSVYIGLAVTAHNNSVLNTSTFSNVSINNSGGGDGTPTPTPTPGNTPTPTPTPSPTPGGSSNLLASDAFNGSIGAINGVSTGSGWGGSWTEQLGDTSVPGYDISSGSALSYSNLAISGNYATGGMDYQTLGRNLNVSTSGPFSTYLNSNGLIGQSGSTLWVSFLLRKDADNEQEASVNLHDRSIPWYTSGATSLIAAGYFGSSSDTGGTRYWSLKLGSTIYQTSTPMTVGQTALLVLRIDFGNTTNVSLYANPGSLGGNAPASVSVQSSSTSITGIQSLAYYGGDGTNQSSLDEIRFGTSYAAVTPTN